MNLPAHPQRPAELVLVAGPNGSGKSTVADDYIQSRFPIWPKLNADRVTKALKDDADLASLASDTKGKSPEEQAANLIDATARGLILLREPLVLETVLASPKYQPLVPACRQAGLIFRLVYITTKHPDINVSRVAQRVRLGGHDVPEDKIRERWVRSMDNLPWFAARADRLIIADNSGDRLQVVALRHLGRSLELFDPDHPSGERLRSLAGTLVQTNP